MNHASLVDDQVFGLKSLPFRGFTVDSIDAGYVSPVKFPFPGQFIFKLTVSSPSLSIYYWVLIIEVSYHVTPRAQATLVIPTLDGKLGKQHASDIERASRLKWLSAKSSFDLLNEKGGLSTVFESMVGDLIEQIRQHS